MRLPRSSFKMRSFVLATIALTADANQVLTSRAQSAGALTLASNADSASDRLVGVIPADALTHFCVVTGYDTFNATLAQCEG